MRKVIFFVSSIILFLVLMFGCYKLYQYIRIKTARIEIVLKNDLTLEFNNDKKVSDYIESINGVIIDDYIIDSTKLGEKTIDFEFINDQNIKLKYSYKIEVIDTVEPLIWLGDSYSVVKGSNINLEEKILCGDNYDSNPNCYVEGSYDLDIVGNYDLVFKAIDNSGNIEEVPFTLRVYEPIQNNTNIKRDEDYTLFEDVINSYKQENAKIGIDVSSWQGDIDFAAIKEAGVEFIIIRVGGTIGTNGEYFLDKKFKYNIEQANKYDIDVGIYFYSYANSVSHARKDARWLLEQIKDYEVNLPIAFDWEEWSSFNNYNLSFFGLTSMAEEFLKIIEEVGYDGMLYSSKSYLEKVWLPTKYDIWLAHYIDETNYQGNYKFWQICDNGKIDGIKGYVDINIMYE